MRRLALSLIALFALPAYAQTQCPVGKTQVLVLGTFHMANPGQDSRNIEADDPRSARRQGELELLVDHLARYRPTVVAVEAAYRDRRVTDAWTEWRAGRTPLTANEIQQVGFRLAARVGLDGVRPVDYPMWMNGWTPSELGDPPPPDTARRAATPVDPETERLRNSTLLEYFRYLNSPAKVATDHAVYLQMLLPAEGRGLYEKTDLVTNWYKRNLRILTNLNRVARPGDRVLLLIGSGHRHVLEDLVRSAPYLCWVDPLEFLGDR